MPRDSKGNGFGHGSTMQDKQGNTLHVVGFATISKGRIDIAKAKAAFGDQYRYYRWTELHNVDPKEQSAAVSDTTDHCAVDRAQVLGAFGEDDGGDKIIWGT